MFRPEIPRRDLRGSKLHISTIIETFKIDLMEAIRGVAPNIIFVDLKSRRLYKSSTRTIRGTVSDHVRGIDYV